MIKSKIKSKLYLLAAVIFLVIIVKQWNSEKDIVEFYLNPKELICDPNKKLLLIAFVVIAPDRFEKRNVIRSTWGNNSLAPDEFKIVFSVGQSKNSTINEMLVNEFLLHEDILQINNFTDSYDYLTTKIMKSFRWVSMYCQSAQYLLRINDDVMVNTFSLINYFKNIKRGENQIYGHLLRKTKPIRAFHKHRVDVRLYPREYYPDYPEGITKILLT
jgi:beta-1,3-N-acetylglucosaminyltransferase 5